MNERRVLESWKEIAAYLGRTEKTCRKWERELGLPIHRLDNSAKAHVFAYEDELDRWKEEKLQAEKVRKAGRLSRLFGLSALSRRTKTRLVAVTSLLVLVIAGLLLRQAILKDNSASSLPLVYDSIAILPLINDSGDPSQEYFVNSMTDLIINELYKVAALDVSPRGSVMRYKNSDKPYKEIAEELNVEALVEASVLRSGNRLRLTARLIDPYRNDKIIWADTWEREYSEILILQSVLSLSIVNGIKVKITPEEKARLVDKKKVDPDAYELFLRGLNRYNAPRSPEYGETFLKVRQDAVDYFQKAIDVDPTLAIAHAWTTHILVQLAIEGLVDEKEVLPKAKEAALKALALDDNLAEAHRGLAMISLTEWNFSGAEREIRRAFELKPKEGFTRYNYIVILTAVGKADEASAFIDQEIAQAEKTSSGRQYSIGRAFFFMFLGRYQDMLDEMKNVVSRASELNYIYTMWFAVAYVLNGRNSEALDEINKVKDLPAPREDAYFLGQHAAILARCGRREEALKKIEEMRALPSQKNIDPDIYLANVYTGLGDKDKAFEYLDKAYKSRSSQMGYLLSQWWLHDLHSDPRFDALSEKMGLPKARPLE